VIGSTFGGCCGFVGRKEFLGNLMVLLGTAVKHGRGAKMMRLTTSKINREDFYNNGYTLSGCHLADRQKIIHVKNAIRYL